MAAWINVTIEQICGTCVEGCCKAMAGMLPHAMKTFVTPLVDEVKMIAKIKNKDFILKNLLNMIKDNNALATAVSVCNFCIPMAWMCCGTFIETIGGFLFGCYGKLFLLCCPAP